MAHDIPGIPLVILEEIFLFPVFRTGTISPPDIPGTDIKICIMVLKIEIHYHPANPHGIVIRLAQKKCSGPPYPAGRVLGIVDLHCPSTAPAGGHLFVLHLTAINTVLPSAAVAAHTLDRNHLFDSAGENAGFFGIGDPQENIIMAAGQNSFMDIPRNLGQCCKHLLCLFCLLGISDFPLFSAGS